MNSEKRKTESMAEKDRRLVKIAKKIPWDKVLMDTPETIWWRYPEWQEMRNFINTLKQCAN